MTGTSQVPGARLDLALPGAQKPVQEWVGAPANGSEPPIRRVWPASPQIIYAERKPRLSADELLARQRGAAGAATSAEPSRRRVGPVVDRPNAPATGRGRVPGLRSVWWSALALAAPVLSLGTPVF